MSFHNLQCALISKEYNFLVAILCVGKKTGTISITQTTSQARTDTASVVVKLAGERAVKQKINTMVDFKDLKGYLAEYYINSEYVKEWKI